MVVTTRPAPGDEGNELVESGLAGPETVGHSELLVPCIVVSLIKWNDVHDTERF